MAFMVISAGCTESQPQYDLQDVLVYIAAGEVEGYVVVVPFYNLTHTGPDAGNLSLQVTIMGLDPLTMNGFNIEPTFIDGLYQPALNLAMNAIGDEDAMLRIKLTGDGEQIIDYSHVLDLAGWPRNMWLALSTTG